MLTPLNHRVLTMLAVFALLQTACATPTGAVDVDRSQPIDIERTTFGYRYTQNGRPLAQESLDAALSHNAGSLAVLKSKRGWEVGTMVVAGPGAGILGWELGKAVSGESNDSILLAVGGGLTVVGLGASIAADAILQRKAVEAWNQQFGVGVRKFESPNLASDSGWRWFPLLGAQRDGGAVGLGITW